MMAVFVSGPWYWLFGCQVHDADCSTFRSLALTLLLFFVFQVHDADRTVHTVSEQSQSPFSVLEQERRLSCRLVSSPPTHSGACKCCLWRCLQTDFPNKQSNNTFNTTENKSTPFYDYMDIGRPLKPLNRFLYRRTWRSWNHLIFVKLYRPILTMNTDTFIWLNALKDMPVTSSNSLINEKYTAILFSPLEWSHHNGGSSTCVCDCVRASVHSVSYLTSRE